MSSKKVSDWNHSGKYKYEVVSFMEMSVTEIQKIKNNQNTVIEVF